MIGQRDIGLGTLRARGAQSPAAQMALHRALQTSAIEPPDLPPDAILLIRRMAADLTPRRRRPGEAHWSARLSDDLAHLAARAVHPGGLHVPEEADAVLFRNRDQWMACLLVRLARGLGPAWWCTALLKEAAAPARADIAIGSLLGHDPVRLPGVLGLLAGAGAVGEVLDPVPRAQVQDLLLQIAETYRLDVIRAILSGSQPPAVITASVGWDRHGETAPDPDAPPPDGRDTVKEPATRPRTRAHPVARFAAARRVLLRRPGGLQDLLMALAQTLRDRPAQLSSPRAQLALLDPIAAPEDVPPPQTHGTVAQPRAPRTEPSPAPERAQPEKAGRAFKAQTAQAPPDNRAARAADAPAQSAPDGPEPAAAEAPAPEGPRAETPTHQGLNLPDTGAAEDGIETAFGGIFYLINLFEAVDIPDALDPDWRTSERLSPWDLLCAVAQALLADPDGLPPPDPVWEALAALSGRAQRAPLGAALTSPPRYRIPPRLAERLCSVDEPVPWARRDGRIRSWTRDGVVLADGVDTPPDTRESARGPRRRTRWSDRARPLPLGAGLDIAPALRHLLGFLVPALRACLADLTGSDGPEEILALPARLYPGPSHVDLQAPVDAISLPLRLAGLDRDPGWLPGWGRVVTFHFD